MALAFAVLGESVTFRTDDTARANLNLVTELASIPDDSRRMKQAIIAEHSIAFDDCSFENATSLAENGPRRR